MWDRLAAAILSIVIVWGVVTNCIILSNLTVINEKLNVMNSKLDYIIHTVDHQISKD